MKEVSIGGHLTDEDRVDFGLVRVTAGRVSLESNARRRILTQTLQLESQTMVADPLLFQDQ